MSSSNAVQANDVLLFGEPKAFFTPLDEMRPLDDLLEPPLLAFIGNLSSALKVGNIPFLLTQSAILEQRLNQITIAERIRSRAKIGELSEEEAYGLADQAALARFREEHRDPSRVSAFADYTLRVLNHHLDHGDFYYSAQELLRQIVVMCWGAFEILVNDTLRSLLNAQPSIIRTFASHKHYKDVLSISSLIEALEARRFDLSSAMGDFFCDNVKLDSLERIREAARLAICDCELDKLLKDDRLWLLAQQRHLIVHRRGIVDSRFKERTGDTTKVGDRLTFTATYVESCLILVRDIGCAIMRSATKNLRPQTSSV